MMKKTVYLVIRGIIYTLVALGTLLMVFFIVLPFFGPANDSWVFPHGPDGKIPTIDLVGSPKCGTILQEWRKCKVDSDCTLVLTLCDWRTSYNKNFVDQIDKIHACLGRPDDCEKPPATQGDKIRCVAKTCQVE